VASVVAHRPPSAPTRATPRRAGFLVAAAVSAAGIVTGLPPAMRMTDFRVYRRAARAVTQGVDVYAPNGSQFRFTYPPFASEFTLPLAPLSIVTGSMLITAVTLLAGVYVTRRSLAATERWPWLVAPALTVALMWTEPMRVTAWLGQINVILMALIVADATARMRRLPRGLLTGVAIGVKLTPGMFLITALAARRWRAALVAGGVFAATVAVGAAVQPGAARAYWTDLLWNTDRVGQITWYGNQSLLGMLTRWMGTGAVTHLVWIAAALAVLVVGVRTAIRIWASGNVLLAVGVVGVVSTLLSPISWTHHWVWCIPVFGGLLARAGHDRRRWLGPALWLIVFEVGPNTRLAHVVFDWAPARIVVGNDYVLAGLVLLVVLAHNPASRAGPGPAVHLNRPDARSEITVS
jgi:alpha-1,2-mannosyltransferase